MPVSGKEALELLLLPAVIVLVGLGAFGLGRLSTAPECPASEVR